MYWNLVFVTLIPIVVTIALYFLVEKTKFKKIPYKWQQIIIGFIFGLIAISGTEFGVPVNGALANVRDSAPILAGLIFGGPSGIIAGVMGGVERFFAAYWGRGTITQIACSVSTLLAGVFAALLRKHFFENKRPSFGFALATAVVIEVFHFVMTFVTNIHQPEEIMKIIKALAIPMIIANAVAVSIPTLIIQLINIKKTEKTEQIKIRNKIKWWLLGSVVVCYLISSGVVFAIQTNQSYQDANTTFKITINDVKEDVVATASRYMNTLVQLVKYEYDDNPYKEEYTAEQINQLRHDYHDLLPLYNIGSIDIIKKDDKGTFVCSSTLDFDMSTFWMTKRESGQTEPGQSEMLHLEMLKPGVTTYVQDFGQRSDTETGGVIYSKYAAVTIDSNYYLAICINEDQFYPLIDDKVKATVMFRHVNENGHILIMDAKDKQITDYKDYIGKESGLTLKGLRNQGKEYERLRGKVYGQDCFYTYTIAETYTIVVILPHDDVLSSRDSSFMLNTFMQVISYAALFILIYVLIDKYVVKKIEGVRNSLDQIAHGDLSVKLTDNSFQEFADLSKDINTTVDVLKRYIDEAKKRIDDELAFAKTIQISALPSTFPAFPDRKEFDIYATMNTAKEVGGDFYDFYMVDSETVAFLIADVSGKGIPAAMFMMEGKAIIKNLAKTLLTANKVLEKANDSLASNNDACMFITCWFGLLNIKTGHVSFANAGHNAPLIYRKGEGYSYIPQKKNAVLAAMEGMPYMLQEFDLKPGDKLYLYTDGVTEATRGDKTLYGEARLEKYLNNHKEDSLKETLEGVQKDIDKFIEGADQFDDITMLTIEYKGK